MHRLTSGLERLSVLSKTTKCAKVDIQSKGLQTAMLLRIEYRKHNSASRSSKTSKEASVSLYPCLEHSASTYYSTCKYQLVKVDWLSEFARFRW
jgi:hypothetical protein